MFCCLRLGFGKAVALHVRAWVEIQHGFNIRVTVERRPPCEGVGRNGVDMQRGSMPCVALHVRAWVEIPVSQYATLEQLVALHVRAWVEIVMRYSLPILMAVALHVRAWVEILWFGFFAGGCGSPSM